MPSMAPSKVPAMSRCISSDRRLRRSTASSRSREKLLQLLMLDAGQHGRVADLVAVEVQDRQYGPSVTGLRNLLECQAVAKGPVSASPSPMTQATISSGLSNAAPKAWLSEYPSSPPSWIDPGVVGATWLEIPPETRTG